MSMPERDTMRLRNKLVIGTTVFLLLGATSFWGSQGPTTTPQQNQQRVQATPLPSDIDPSDPALPSWVPKPAHTATAKPTPTPGNVQPGLEPEPLPGTEVGAVTKTGDKYTYRSQVNEVTLSATVLDARRHLVTNLAPTNFAVYEDNQPQTITSFKREDIPVSIGIVVDNSGSMRTKRAAVTKAVLNLIQASNPQDEVFVVNFNDDPFLDQDFTASTGLLREALDRVDSRGGTALYDAVIASADHLAKGAKKDKKVLLVITDGVDNESRESLETAIRAVQNDSGPTIYTIGILSKDEPGGKRAKRALQALSDQTGGVAFFPTDLEEVDRKSTRLNSSHI